MSGWRPRRVSESCAVAARRRTGASGKSRAAPPSSLVRLFPQPDRLEVLVGVMVRADAPTADDAEIRDDPVPPEHGVLVGLRVHRVFLDVRDERLPLGRVGLAALPV